MLLLLPIATLAQAIPTTTTAVPQELKSQQLTAEDTIRAVHNLFESRRSGGIVLTGGAIGGDLLAAYLATESQDQNSFITFSFGTHTLMFGTIAAPLAAIGIRKLVAYRSARERVVIEEFRKSHRLDPKIQRRLKPKFFSQPTYKPPTG